MRAAIGGIAVLFALLVGVYLATSDPPAQIVSNSNNTQSNTSKDLSKLVQSNHRLAAGLYSKIREEQPAEQNLVVAPDSALMAIATMLTVESEETAPEIRKVLDLYLDREPLERAIREILDSKAVANQPEQSFLGLEIEKGEEGGVRVKNVVPGSRAEQAGFLRGDELVAVHTTDDPSGLKEIHSVSDFIHALDEAPAILRIRCRAGDKFVTRRIYLTHRPVPAATALKKLVQYRAESALCYPASHAPSASLLAFANKTRIFETMKTDFEKDIKKIQNWLGQRNFPDPREVELPEMALGRELRMAFVDSVYFRPNWSSAVRVRSTPEIKFDLGKRPRSVPAISLMGRFLVAKDNEAEMVELPCTGGLAVALLVPQKTALLGALEKRLANPDWSKLLGQGELKESTIRLPQFDLYELRDLRDPLAKLGMAATFAPPEIPESKKKNPELKKDPDPENKKDSDPAKQDDSDPKKDKKPAKNQLASVGFIQQVHLTTKIEESENLPEEKSKDQAFQLTVDRPFLCVVFVRRTQQVLLVGRVVNPRAN